MIDINELRRLAEHHDGVTSSAPIKPAALLEILDRLEAAEKDIAIKEEVIDSLAAVVKRLDAQCDAAEKERDVLNAKVERMEQRLRLILEEPENTMSNSKAMREMLKQARLALEGSK